jgi:hypothetical protein
MQRGWAIALLASMAALALYLRHHEAAERERSDRLFFQLSRLGATPLLPAQPALRTAPLDPATIDAIAARLQSRPAAAPPPAQDAPPAAAAAAVPPSAEAEAALQSARGRLDAALAHGRLGRADVTAMREQLASVPPEEANELRRQIALGINQGRLVPDDPMFVFP